MWVTTPHGTKRFGGIHPQGAQSKRSFGWDTRDKWPGLAQNWGRSPLSCPSTCKPENLVGGVGGLRAPVELFWKTRRRLHSGAGSLLTSMGTSFQKLGVFGFHRTANACHHLGLHPPGILGGNIPLVTRKQDTFFFSDVSFE